MRYARGVFSAADVHTFASSLPGVTVGSKWNRRTWLVGDKGFVWDRPLTKADIKRYGDNPLPQGDLLGVKVEDLDAKDALLAIAPAGFFTIEHFNGYPAVLVELRLARPAEVRRAIVDAWRTVASPALQARLDAKPTRPAKAKPPPPKARTKKPTAKKRA
ncbi:MAG: MmcQ/YjbR family DNA-binding protein [Kofleriaceae bacterium]